MTLLAAAAAVVLVGGALAAGSGILRRPAVVPPAPSRGPLAIASAVRSFGTATSAVRAEPPNARKSSGTMRCSIAPRCSATRRAAANSASNPTVSWFHCDNRHYDRVNFLLPRPCCPGGTNDNSPTSSALGARGTKEQPKSRRDG